MKPKSGQFVKVIFRNATQMEGVVVEWSDTESVLRAIDGSSFLVINQTAQDVMAHKIIVKYTPPEELPKRFNELVSQFKEVYEQPSNDDLRTMKLAKLKVAMIDQEKKIVAHNLTKHVSSHISGASYGSPFIKK